MSHGNGKHRLNSWEMGTRVGMVDRKWEGNGNSSLGEIPVSRVNHIFSIIFLNGHPFLHSNLA